MKATLFNRKSAISQLIIILLLEFSIFFYIVKSNKELVAFPLMLIIFTLIIFFTFISKLYSREIDVLITEKSLSIEYFKEEFEKEFTEKHFYSDIIAYKIYFPTYKYSCISLKFKNQKNREYCFLEKIGIWKTEHYNKEIFKSLHKQFQEFNAKQELKDKIKYEKSFFASKLGLFFIALLCISWLVLLFLNILKHTNPKHIFQLCFLVIPILHIISQRSNAINFYKETINESPLQ